VNVAANASVEVATLSDQAPVAASPQPDDPPVVTAAEASSEHAAPLPVTSHILDCCLDLNLLPAMHILGLTVPLRSCVLCSQGYVEVQFEVQVGDPSKPFAQTKFQTQTII